MKKEWKKPKLVVVVIQGPGEENVMSGCKAVFPDGAIAGKGTCVDSCEGPCVFISGS